LSLAIFQQGQIRKRLSKIADYTSGMTRIYIECVLMAYKEDAYQLLRHKRYLSVVIHHHMGVTMELSAPMLRCGKVVSTGPPCMMTPSHFSMLQPMSEAWKYQYKGCNANDFESPD
jgi:hypothetical protein